VKKRFLVFHLALLIHPDKIDIFIKLLRRIIIIRFSPAVLLSLAMFLFFIVSIASYGDSPVIDPYIPDGETITYTVTTGDETYPLVQHTVLVKEQGKELYEIRTETKTEDTIIRIDRKTMAVVYSRTKRKNPEYTIERETTILENRIMTEPGEITLVDFSGIQQILRGFPFKKEESLTLRFAGSNNFTMSIKIKKETTIKTDVGEIRCYEVELGLNGFWGSFVPKTHLWYSVNPPHYLVQYKGQEGPPGSPKIFAVLTGYYNK
jgi:hypothetical protein